MSGARHLTRRHNRGRRAFLLWSLVLLGAVVSGTDGASAHDMWVVPPEEPITAGELVRVPLWVGHGGEAEPVRRNPRRIVRFDASGPASQVEVVGMPGAEPAGAFRPDDEGTWVVGFETTAAFSELDAESFERYLAEEGLIEISRRRQRDGDSATPGRELYSRSLKSLFRVGGPEPRDRRIGLPLELLLESVGSTSAPSGLEEKEDARSVTLRLLLRGEPLVGARVDLRRVDEAEPRSAGTTDSRGRVALPADGGAATWVAASVYMEPASGTEAEKADWRSWFATSTFHLE